MKPMPTIPIPTIDSSPGLRIAYEMYTVADLGRRLPRRVGIDGVLARELRQTRIVPRSLESDKASLDHLRGGRPVEFVEGTSRFQKSHAKTPAPEW